MMEDCMCRQILEKTTMAVGSEIDLRREPR